MLSKSQNIQSLRGAGLAILVVVLGMTSSVLGVIICRSANEGETLEVQRGVQNSREHAALNHIEKRDTLPESGKDLMGWQTTTGVLSAELELSDQFSANLNVNPNANQR